MKVSAVLAILAFAAGSFAEAELKKVGKGRIGLCGFPGFTCAKTKRAAFAVSEALADAEARIKSPIGLCGFPGMTCHKARRSLQDVHEALERTVDLVYERDPDPEAEARIKKPLRGRIGLCGFMGFTCHKSKRDAIAEPEARINKPLRGRIGRCGFMGFTCHKAKRGVELIQEEDPEYFKDECFAEGGECAALVNAAGAFQAATADAETAAPASRARRSAEPKIKSHLGLCGYPGFTCAREAKAYAIAKANNDPAAEQAEKDCYGPDGDCTVVQRSLDELETALNQAVEDVAKLD